MTDQIPGKEPRRSPDWAGLSVFALSLSVGVTVVVVSIAELDRPMQQGTVLATAITAVLGAMVGAISTYAGLGRKSRRDDEE